MFARPNQMFRHATRLQLLALGCLLLLCHWSAPSWCAGLLSTGSLVALHFWLLSMWFGKLPQQQSGLVAFAWLWLPKMGLVAILLLAMGTGWRPPLASLICGLLLAIPVLLRAYQTTYMGQSVQVGVVDR